MIRRAKNIPKQRHPTGGPLLAVAVLCCACTTGGGAGGRAAVVAKPTKHRAASNAASDHDAAAQVRALGDAWWELQMRSEPQQATYLGDRRYDDRLPDLSERGRWAVRHRMRALLGRARRVREAELGSADRVTLRLLIWRLRSELEHVRRCHPALWHVDQLFGPQVWLAELPMRHTVRRARDLATLLARYRGVKKLLADKQRNLERGLKLGWIAPRTSVERVIGQLKRLTGTTAASSPFVASLELPTSWPAVRRARAIERLTGAVERSVYPALEAYRAFLADHYLGRTRARPGLTAQPKGAACYRARIELFTGSRWSPERIHRVGREELARLTREMRVIARRLGHSGPLPEMFTALRAEPQTYAKSAEALVTRASRAVARARAVLPRLVTHLPRTRVEVRPMPASRAADAPAAYYFEAPDDGSRPAYFYLNTSDLKAQPLFNIEPLAFHEALPGHHLQIALAKEQPDLPRFRRHEGATAFVEGWALYAELLAGEMGLYSDDRSRLGALSYQAWRAARLVIDTGIHALGWKRERALELLRSHTTLTRREIANEVDRYIGWPGQALAYMLGRMAIQGLRRRAEERLGKRFDLRSFHDELLRRGALPLPVLRPLIASWIAERERQGSGGKSPPPAHK